MSRAVDWLCALAAGGTIGALASILIGALPLMVEPSSSHAVGQEQTP